jgi:hypothetical protein
MGHRASAVVGVVQARRDRGSLHHSGDHPNRQHVAAATQGGSRGLHPTARPTTCSRADRHIHPLYSAGLPFPPDTQNDSLARRHEAWWYRKGCLCLLLLHVHAPTASKGQQAATTSTNTIRGAAKRQMTPAARRWAEGWSAAHVFAAGSVPPCETPGRRHSSPACQPREQHNQQTTHKQEPCTHEMVMWMDADQLEQPAAAARAERPLPCTARAPCPRHLLRDKEHTMYGHHAPAPSCS